MLKDIECKIMKEDMERFIKQKKLSTRDIFLPGTRGLNMLIILAYRLLCLKNWQNS